EGISQEELDAINGTGIEGRVTKDDILAYIAAKSTVANNVQATLHQSITKENRGVETLKYPISEDKPKESFVSLASSGENEILEMSRMGKIIANHMVESVQTSVHVQSYIEVDVTNIWNWRNKVKDGFKKRTGENLTFTPIFMEAVAKALIDFPMMNISVQGDKIIKKKHINLGMATAMPDGNLIVRVIKNADQLNLLGMAKQVNDLANRARNGKLKPDDTQDGTYTVTNIGGFGSIIGTAINNQQQVGILAIFSTRKVPKVIETAEGDFIGIRHRMFLSHS